MYGQRIGRITPESARLHVALSTKSRAEQRLMRLPPLKAPVTYTQAKIKMGRKKHHPPPSTFHRIAVGSCKYLTARGRTARYGAIPFSDPLPSNQPIAPGYDRNGTQFPPGKSIIDTFLSDGPKRKSFKIN